MSGSYDSLCGVGMARNSFFWFVASMILIHMEVQLIVPSFPELREYYQVNDYWISLLVSANMIGFCIASPIYGVLYSRIGAKNSYLLGSAIFLFASLGCVFLPPYFIFMSLRFFQGFGGAVASVVGFSEAVKGNNEAQISWRIGLLNGFVSFAIAAGPILGNIVQAYFSFRGNLSLIVVFASINFMMMYFMMSPRSNKSKEPIQHKKSWNGFLFCIKNRLFVCSILTKDVVISAYLIYFSWSSLIFVGKWKISSFAYGGGNFLIVICYSLITLSSDKLRRICSVHSYLGIAFFAWIFSVILSFYVDENNQVTAFSTSLSAVILFSIASALVVQYLFTTAFIGVSSYKEYASSIAAISRFSIPAFSLALWGKVFPPSWDGVCHGFVFFGCLGALGVFTITKYRFRIKLSSYPSTLKVRP